MLHFSFCFGAFIAYALPLFAVSNALYQYLYMSLNSFFSSFLPKEEKILPKYKKMASRIVVGADLFTELVSATEHDKQVELYTKIKAIETECDNIIIDIFEDINNAFVTPFDREDMHQLCSDMGDGLYQR